MGFGGAVWRFFGNRYVPVNVTLTKPIAKEGSINRPIWIRDRVEQNMFCDKLSEICSGITEHLGWSGSTEFWLYQSKEPVCSNPIQANQSGRYILYN